jgi:hypothetical protein
LVSTTAGGALLSSLLNAPSTLCRGFGATGSW